MDVENYENNKVTYLEIIIPLFYILNQYRVMGVSVGLIGILIAIAIRVMRRRPLNAYMPLFAFFGFMLLHDIIKTAVAGFATNTWIERCIYLVFLMCIPGNVNKDNLYKIWKVIGAIAMLGLLYQSVQVYALGQSVSIIKILPFFDLASTSVSEYDRPHSIFLEPAAYSTWIMPLLCMSLSKKENIWAIAVSFTVLLSTSSSGILVTGIAWLFFAITGVGEKRGKKNTIILVSVLIIGVGVLSNTSLFAASFQKLTNISLNNTSNNTRLMLGFIMFAGLPLVQKIFGFPYLSVESYMRSGKVNLGIYGLSLNTSYLGFVNALSNCLLNYGLIGAAFYLNLFFRLFRDSSKADKCYVILCFASIFGQSVFWNSLFVTQFAVMLASAEFMDYKRLTFGRGYD